MTVAIHRPFRRWVQAEQSGLDLGRVLFAAYLLDTGRLSDQCEAPDAVLVCAADFCLMPPTPSGLCRRHFEEAQP